MRDVVVIVCGFMLISGFAQAQSDPGPRTGVSSVGGRFATLSVKESQFFDSGANAFKEIASVAGDVSDTEPGLGPRFNMNSCVGCHAHPAVGGSSPAANPQVDVAPWSQVSPLIDLGIISFHGPVREVRFTTDGGVHDLFTIAGLPGTPSTCNIAQPDFAKAHSNGTLRFRIPTPVFGAGLIEAIPDAAIAANAFSGKPFGIFGNVNRNGNDGTVTRFGWKAQNKSLLLFSGEAYNVEQGISNELFPDERGEAGVPDPVACHGIVTTPQDTVKYNYSGPQAVLDDIGNFANFMRFLAPAARVTAYGNVTSAQIADGEVAFNKAGCSVCHVMSMTTGNHTTQALRYQTVNLFSDLLVHDVGTGDGIAQGLASGAQFRTAPLWGVGQRLFFLHDGRTSDLVEAVNAHDGEAKRVIHNFNGLSVGRDAPSNLNATERQNVLNFLRSL
jgi:CxxC motif-containing protein (DUF1111 family)